MRGFSIFVFPHAKLRRCSSFSCGVGTFFRASSRSCCKRVGIVHPQGIPQNLITGETAEKQDFTASEPEFYRLSYSNLIDRKARSVKSAESKSPRIAERNATKWPRACPERSRRDGARRCRRCQRNQMAGPPAVFPVRRGIQARGIGLLKQIQDCIFSAGICRIFAVVNPCKQPNA